jgi:hypothetical protein
MMASRRVPVLSSNLWCMMTTHQALHPEDPKDIESRHLNPGDSTVVLPFDCVAGRPLDLHMADHVADRPLGAP